MAERGKFTKKIAGLKDSVKKAGTSKQKAASQKGGTAKSAPKKNAASKTTSQKNAGSRAEGLQSAPVRRKAPAPKDEASRKRLMRKQALRRKKRQKALIIRVGIILAVLVAIVLILVIASAIIKKNKAKAAEAKAISEIQYEIPEGADAERYARLAASQYDYDKAIGILKKYGDKSKETKALISSYEEEKETLVAVDPADAIHLCFPMLMVQDRSETADSTAITTTQFEQILQDLYVKGYVLVSMEDLVQTYGEGKYEKAELYLPAGKKPLVISEEDVCYPMELIFYGYPYRVQQNEDRSFSNIYFQADGTMLAGEYDVVSILEKFVKEHPDFSYHGAKGTLGITGYEGVLGYRTRSLFGLSAEEGNSYANSFGIYDVDQEIAQAKEIVEALKEAGWSFACNGYANISFDSEISLVQQDMDQWKTEVEPVIGETDLMLYPMASDIGGWGDYQADDEKYAYLKGLGFNKYCAQEEENATWLQIRPEYVRQGYHLIDSYSAYQTLLSKLS